MSDIVIPKNYKSQLNLYETQVAIKTVKDFFQGLLAERLHLLRVSAPLFVDNLFANCPLPFVQRIYYLNEDLYHYYLGREDQSVNEKVLVSRIDQQILVTQLGNRFVGSDAVQNTEPKLRRYLYRNSSIMMAISTIHLLMLGKEGRQRRKELWQSLKKENPKLYRRLRLGSISGLTCLPGAPGAAVVIGGYRMARRIWQFQ